MQHQSQFQQEMLHLVVTICLQQEKFPMRLRYVQGGAAAAKILIVKETYGDLDLAG